ncbi:hypothetical protein E4U43_001147 [Claviceps pusilla]|uniref:Glutamine amidotransferase domain-containing protein n=1 Tax=Claviceps pusilla TaxID=123648 RepID=A0A9P7NGC2_9HYPO|nr:hypothetical protein E4U43_001147 [Claviceps pusilla]
MTPSPPLRLAILECDTPQPKTAAKFTNYTGVFAALLNAAAAAESSSPPAPPLSSQVTISSYDIVNHPDTYPAVDAIDAVLLTGSRHTAFHNDPWILKLLDFTTRALQSGRVKVVGICFGHQIIGRALGAGVGQSDKGWEVAVTEVDLTDVGRQIFGLDKLRIHQMHRDIVHSSPPNATPLGSNPFCPVQAMYQPGRYLSVQGHPEFTEEIISEILVNRHNAGIFSRQVYEGAMARAPIPHDGVAVGRAILKFIREG